MVSGFGCFVLGRDRFMVLNVLDIYLFCSDGYMLKVLFVLFAERKNLVLRAQNLDQLKSESEQQLSASSMESKNEFPELNRNLYPDIEPYSTGFLKVSDLHTIYWEQSGNPNGHVRNHYTNLISSLFFPSPWIS